jgi:signal transduction histidine kinase/ActR/RegA family two-component response regulator
MALRWGPQFIFIYNDGYLPILGDKHPAALGKAFREVWPELYSDLAPVHEALLAGTRAALFAEDMPLRIQRHGTSWEEAFFTLSYSPVADHTTASGIGGIHVTAIETTQRIRAQQLQRGAEDALRENERNAAQALERLLQRRTAEERQAREALRATEEALRQSQKMEAIGQLSGGIAHDFNNLLQSIVGSLGVAQKLIGLGRADESQRFITTALASSSRAAALTHRLLAFARRQPLDPTPVRANQLIASMEDLLRRTVGETVHMQLALAGGLWASLCDYNQLENAIVNLAINARDAMPNGGTLTIETSNANLDGGCAPRQLDVTPGQYVCISVTDTGGGMAPDVVARAFDPFFTTKPMGPGTGLGLSMIYGFARQSEGHVDIHSEVARGTTVKLYLPRTSAASAEPAVDESEYKHKNPSAHNGATVLVIEDELVVRELIVEGLRELGYHTLEAAEGHAGLGLLNSKERIDLLLTDISLPGLNGRQVADAARHGRPELKVLFMTGYEQNAAVARGFLEPGMQLLAKPFAMDVLATRVRAMLEDKQPRAPA